MKRSVKIINTLMILIGIFTLYADYVIAVEMDLGTPTATIIDTLNAENIVQKPLALFIGTITSIALLGGFLIVYPIICLRGGISCIGFISSSLQ